jgi:elongation factor 4
MRAACRGAAAASSSSPSSRVVHSSIFARGSSFAGVAAAARAPCGVSVFPACAAAAPSRAHRTLGSNAAPQPPSPSPSSSPSSPPLPSSHLDQSTFRARETPPGVPRLVARYASIPVERIRTFSIVAHIDHGKSTLSDALLTHVGNIWPTTKGGAQVLDTLDVERQRGITVKAQSASMVWTDPSSGAEYLLNLIDTPGHVDFSYEVSRSLAACQGALLLVDASQGVQAQTVANHDKAADAKLKLIPVLTKIDLPTADPEPALLALEAAFGFAQDDALWTSAKSGEGIPEVFPAMVARLPPPSTSEARSRPLRCLLFDSHYDEYRGVVCAIQVVDGTVRPGDVIVAHHSGDRFTVQEVGLMAPARVPVPHLSAGHIGFMICNMKDVRQARVGDTFYRLDRPVDPLPGFRPAKPMVFASLYPIDSGDFGALQTAVERLTLNDASVTVEKESSGSLGFGLRCGFLGLLHMDVFNQRLQDEFRTPVIITAPMVAYKVKLKKDGSVVTVERPGDFPEPHEVETYYEPTAHVSIMAPSAFVSPLLGLLTERRGEQEDLIYLNQAGAAAGGGAAGSSKGAMDAAVLASLAALPSAPTKRAAAADVGGEGGKSRAAGAAPPPPAAAAAEADDDEEEDEEEEEGEDDECEGEDENEEDEEEEDSARGGSSKSSSFKSSSSSSSSLSSFSGGGGVNHAALASTADRVVLKFRVPWAEVVSNMYDAVKSMTAGYASLDWLPGEYQEADIVKVDLLVNSKPVDALSFVAHSDKAVAEGRRVAQRLKGVITRQQFEIVIQAAIGTKIVAKERIPPFRKDVLIKSGKTVGGGDKTRKEKLLAKQREGKKRMKTVGNVQLTQEAFHSILSSK